MVNIMELGLAVNKIAEGVMWLINALNEGVGNYGVAVILFTLILKAAMSPLDVWQKIVMTKNNRAMERMKPQLEKLQKQYANNKELYSQKQMELYRKEKYSMLGTCLPTILSLVIFILVFSGFNGMIKLENQNMYNDMKSVYRTAEAQPFTETYEEAFLEHLGSEAYSEAYEATEGDEAAKIAAGNAAKEAAISNDTNIAAAHAAAISTEVPETDAEYAGNLARTNAKAEAARAAVVSKFESDYRKQNSFMWVKNVFMPDNWKQPIPDYNTFIGTGIGKLNIEISDTSTDYNEVMSPLIAAYNGAKGKRWNGYMILPIIAAALSFLSTKLMKQTQPPTPAPSADGSASNMQNAMQSNMKMMQYFMPIMMGVLALLYSTAFTIYMLISNLFTVAFQFFYNLAVKQNDKRAEQKRLETTYK